MDSGLPKKGMLRNASNEGCVDSIPRLHIATKELMKIGGRLKHATQPSKNPLLARKVWPRRSFFGILHRSPIQSNDRVKTGRLGMF